MAIKLICWSIFAIFTFWTAPSGAQSSQNSRINNDWIVGASASIEGSRQPLAPLLIDFASRLSEGTNFPPEVVLAKTNEYKNFLQKQNISQKWEDVAAAWDAGGFNIIGFGIRTFHRDYLADATSEPWNSLIGFSRKVASRPGFWSDIEGRAAADPTRTAKVVNSLSREYFGIDRDMDGAEIRARVPALVQDERLQKIADDARNGRLSADQVREELNRLGGKLADKFDRIILAQRANNLQMNSVRKWLERQKSLEDQRRTAENVRAEYAEMQAGIAILASVAHMAKLDAGTVRAIQAAGVLTDLASKFAIYSLSGGSALVLTQNSLSSFGALANLMQGDQADPTTQLLQRIDQKIDQLRAEMLQSFAIVNMRLDVLLDTTFKTYREVLQLRRDVDSARVAIAQLEDAVWNIDSRLSKAITTLSRQELVRRRERCLGAQPSKLIDANLFHDCNTGFYTDGVSRAFDSLTVIDDQYDPAISARILKDESSARAIRYLARFAMQELRSPTLSFALLPERLPNSTAWEEAVADYIELATKWPQMMLARSDRKRQISDLILAGRDLRRATVSLAGAGEPQGELGRKNKHVDVWSKLEEYYKRKLTMTLDAFEAAASEAIDRKLNQSVFENNSDRLDAIPSNIRVCSDFKWKYAPAGESSAVDVAIPQAGLPAQIEILNLSPEVKAKWPKWMINSGGLASNDHARIRNINVCVKQVLEHTSRRTCFGGTYSGGQMTSGTATLQISYEIMTPAGLRPPADPKASPKYENKTYFSTLDFKGGEPCSERVATGHIWNARIQNSLPQFMEKADNMRKDVERSLKGVISKDGGDMNSIWFSATSENARGASPYRNSRLELSGARVLLDRYLALTFPELYADDGLSAILSDNSQIRIADAEIMDLTLVCLREPERSICKNSDFLEIVNSIYDKGWKEAFLSLGHVKLELIKKRIGEWNHEAARPQLDFAIGSLKALDRRLDDMATKRISIKYRVQTIKGVNLRLERHGVEWFLIDADRVDTYREVDRNAKEIHLKSVAGVSEIRFPVVGGVGYMKSEMTSRWAEYGRAIRVCGGWNWEGIRCWLGYSPT